MFLQEKKVVGDKRSLMAGSLITGSTVYCIKPFVIKMFQSILKLELLIQFPASFYEKYFYIIDSSDIEN